MAVTPINEGLKELAHSRWLVEAYVDRHRQEPHIRNWAELSVRLYRQEPVTVAAALACIIKSAGTSHEGSCFRTTTFSWREEHDTALATVRDGDLRRHLSTIVIKNSRRMALLHLAGNDATDVVRVEHRTPIIAEWGKQARDLARQWAANSDDMLGITEIDPHVSVLQARRLSRFGGVVADFAQGLLAATADQLPPTGTAH